MNVILIELLNFIEASSFLFEEVLTSFCWWFLPRFVTSDDNESYFGLDFDAKLCKNVFQKFMFEIVAK